MLIAIYFAIVYKYVFLCIMYLCCMQSICIKKCVYDCPDMWTQLFYFEVVPNEIICMYTYVCMCVCVCVNVSNYR